MSKLVSKAEKTIGLIQWSRAAITTAAVTEK